MRRQTSFFFFGIFAACAAAQIAACSSSSNSGQAGNDAGSDASQANNEDTGAPSKFTAGCNGPLPVMTVRNPAGGQMAPDWSCYAPDGGPAVGAYFHVEDEGDGGDAGTDAATDAGTDASDAGGTTIVDAGSDSATPPNDAGQGTDASVASSYRIHITDFGSGQPPVGSLVDIFWGASSDVDAAFTGTVDDAGLVEYPVPPAETQTLSYHVRASATEAPFYYYSTTIIPPGVDTPFLGNGQIEGNSVSTSTLGVLISAVFGSASRDATLGILTTAAIDCAGNDVQGAYFTLIDSATGQAVATGTGGSDPRVTYFVNGLPNSSCTYTNNIARGVWSMANAPVNEPGTTHVYTLQMWGRMVDSDGSNGRLMSAAPIESYSGGISNVRPYLLGRTALATPDGG
jgi:hypothetical protein